MKRPCVAGLVVVWCGTILGASYYVSKKTAEIGRK